MVNLIKNDIIKIKILNQYKKKNIDYTCSYLAKLLKGKFETINKALEFFVKIDVLKKDIKEHGKRTFVYYSLTDIGENLLSSDKL